MIGGGLSGVGAAVGAARTGVKTVVVERTGYLGGWMRGTGLGNVMAIKGWRPSLQEGVLLDVAKKMIGLRAEGYPDLQTVLNRGNLLVTNHEMLPHAFQSLVLESGAEILYFSTYTDSLLREGIIEAIIVQTPTVRAAIRGKVFIDCTGLATVAAASGAAVNREEAFMGLAAWIGGVDVERFQAFAKTRPKEGSSELRRWMEQKLGHPITRFSSSGPSPMNYPWDDWWERNSGLYGDFFRQAVDKGELPLFYSVGEKGMLSFIEGVKVIQFGVAGGISRPRTYIVGVDPTDPRQVSEAHYKSTQLLFKYIRFFNQYIPGFEKAQLTRVAETTLNRSGRYLAGEYEPDSDAINQESKSEACAAARAKERDLPGSLSYTAAREGEQPSGGGQVLIRWQALSNPHAEPDHGAGRWYRGRPFRQGWGETQGCVRPEVQSRLREAGIRLE